MRKEYALAYMTNPRSEEKQTLLEAFQLMNKNILQILGLNVLQEKAEEPKRQILVLKHIANGNATMCTYYGVDNFDKAIFEKMSLVTFPKTHKIFSTIVHKIVGTQKQFSYFVFILHDFCLF